METNVIVTGRDGEVVIVSKSNSDIGYIRVIQTRLLINNVGFAKYVSLSALVFGSVNDLTSLGWINGQILPGRIVVKEGIAPFESSRPDKDLKRKSKSGDVCKFNGFPIYRKTMYTTNLNESDVFLTEDKQSTF